MTDDIPELPIVSRDPVVRLLTLDLTDWVERTVANRWTDIGVWSGLDGRSTRTVVGGPSTMTVFETGQLGRLPIGNWVAFSGLLSAHPRWGREVPNRLVYLVEEREDPESAHDVSADGTVGRDRFGQTGRATVDRTDQPTPTRRHRRRDRNRKDPPERSDDAAISADTVGADDRSSVESAAGSPTEISSRRRRETDRTAPHDERGRRHHRTSEQPERSLSKPPRPRVFGEEPDSYDVDSASARSGVGETHIDRTDRIEQASIDAIPTVILETGRAEEDGDDREVTGPNLRGSVTEIADRSSPGTRTHPSFTHRIEHDTDRALSADTSQQPSTPSTTETVGGASKGGQTRQRTGSTRSNRELSGWDGVETGTTPTSLSETVITRHRARQSTTGETRDRADAVRPTVETTTPPRARESRGERADGPRRVYAREDASRREADRKSATKRSVQIDGVDQSVDRRASSVRAETSAQSRRKTAESRTQSQIAPSVIDPMTSVLSRAGRRRTDEDDRSVTGQARVSAERIDSGESADVALSHHHAAKTSARDDRSTAMRTAAASQGPDRGRSGQSGQTRDGRSSERQRTESSSATTRDRTAQHDTRDRPVGGTTTADRQRPAATDRSTVDPEIAPIDPRVSTSTLTETIFEGIDGSVADEDVRNRDERSRLIYSRSGADFESGSGSDPDESVSPAWEQGRDVLRVPMTREGLSRERRSVSDRAETIRPNQRSVDDRQPSMTVLSVADGSQGDDADRRSSRSDPARIPRGSARREHVDAGLSRSSTRDSQSAQQSQSTQRRQSPQLAPSASATTITTAATPQDDRGVADSTSGQRERVDSSTDGTTREGKTAALRHVMTPASRESDSGGRRDRRQGRRSTDGRDRSTGTTATGGQRDGGPTGAEERSSWTTGGRRSGHRDDRRGFTDRTGRDGDRYRRDPRSAGGTDPDYRSDQYGSVTRDRFEPIRQASPGTGSRPGPEYRREEPADRYPRADHANSGFETHQPPIEGMTDGSDGRAWRERNDERRRRADANRQTSTPELSDVLSADATTDRVVNKLYRELERKMRIERTRRGL